MSSLVLDASLVVGWLLAEEVGISEAVIEAKLETYSVVVPQIWHIELRSALLNAERRKRITTERFDDLLHSFMQFPLSIDNSPQLAIAVSLARKHRVSVYDAIYLELAIRSDFPLATLDRGLANAGFAENCLFEELSVRPRTR